jgi:hypothetical protein
MHKTPPLIYRPTVCKALAKNHSFLKKNNVFTELVAATTTTLSQKHISHSIFVVEEIFQDNHIRPKDTQKGEVHNKLGIAMSILVWIFNSI